MAGNGHGNGKKRGNGNGLEARVAFLEKVYLEDRERWRKSEEQRRKDDERWEKHHRQINVLLAMINRNTRNHDELVREVKKQNEEIKKQGEETQKQGDRLDRVIRRLYRRDEGF